MTSATIITGDSPTTLVGQLDHDLASAPLSPFMDEIIVVQSLGMERWLRQQLAIRQGCTASVQFPFPAAFCHRLARTLHRATDGARSTSLDRRFDEDALAWQLFDLLNRATINTDPALAALRGYLANADAEKTFGLARRIATRFDDYLLYRPDVLLDWERSEIADTEPAHVRWQAFLWRQLAGQERPQHLARWFIETVEMLEQAKTAPDGLPPRVSVFGISTLARLFVRLLHALARFVPVRFYVFTPALPTWKDARQVNPVFEAFGGASRELMALLIATAVPVEVRTLHAALRTPVTVLNRLQDDIGRGVVRSTEAEASPPVVMLSGDRSLTVHVCHSPMREMEVLRDQLLDAFVADPTLRPHDILVLVPDVPLYGPLADAVFGGGDADIPAVPHRVADRPLSQDASAARALLQLLSLVSARGTASEVLNLLQFDIVRRAAGISVHDLDRIARWIQDAGIRWGKDGATRHTQFNLPAIEDNSWRRGLDRLVMGYATGPIHAAVDGVLPVAGDTLGDVDLLGQFVVWVDGLFNMIDACRRPRPLAEWSALLDDAVGWLVEPDGISEQTSVDRVLDDVRALGELGQSVKHDGEVTFEVVHHWLLGALDSDRHGTGFLSGGMTICAMKPMRAIPFRIIAMLGLDDSAFPRRDRRSAFDLLEIHRRAGDRDMRADDRQLFLDTLLCAEERLILSYVGRSERNNAIIAPSVVIAELLDAVDQAFHAEPLPGISARRLPRHDIVVEHRLQPFSVSYFDGTDPRLFSFSAATARSVDGARNKGKPPVFIDAPVNTSDAGAGAATLEASLDDLIECWMNPSKFYCARTLGLHIPRDNEVLEDVEPMEVNALSQTIQQQRMLNQHVTGDADETIERALAIARNDLPSGALASEWHDALRRDIDGLLQRAGRPVFLEPVSVELSGNGWRLTGRIDGCTAAGRFQVRAATIKPRDEVRAWITHVVLTRITSQSGSATRPVTTLMGKDKSLVFRSPDHENDVLEFLMQGYRRAHVTALPFFCIASKAFNKKTRTPKSVAERLETAEKAYHGSEYAAGDATDPYVNLCWRGRSPFEDAADEFIALAESFWEPLEASSQSASDDEAVA